MLLLGGGGVGREGREEGKRERGERRERECLPVFSCSKKLHSTMWQPIKQAILNGFLVREIFCYALYSDIFGCGSV